MNNLRLEPSKGRMEMLKVGIVGCGLMGAGIAEVCARAGNEVLVVESSADAAKRGEEKVLRSLERAHSKGMLDLDEVLARLTFTDDLEELADRQLVVEAIAEVEEIKTALFRDLDRIVVDENAILASNTSSIPIMKLGVATSRPDRVIGLHFFNPVPVLNLVELVPSLLTDPAVLEEMRTFAEQGLGKHVIESQDRAGFVVNALLVPFILSAIRMVESGFATAADVDQGFVQGCAHPQGPLALADLIGLDTTAAIAESLYQEFKEPLFAPPSLLARMVEAGLVGRKAGRGFYEYAS